MLLELLCAESVNKAPSYNDLAIRMEKLTAIAVCKQAFWKKLSTNNCLSFFKLVLSTLISTKVPKVPSSLIFKRILIQDSTIIKLPQRLFDSFSGVANEHTQVCNARIQAVYELITGSFISFSIDSYSKNDAKAASELELQKGDLVLRDRGYHTYEEMQRHQKSQADFILRHRQKTLYLDPITREPLDLLFILKQQSQVDMQVRLNNKEQTLVRLVATRVSEEIANLRKMKLKKEAKGHAPSVASLELTSWTIFITTISIEAADFKQLLQLYALRWRIENIFKAWKSNLNFSAFHNVSKNQFLCITIARLIMIVLAFCQIFVPLQAKVLDKFGKDLSLMKSIRYIQINNNILQLAVLTGEVDKLDELAIVFSKYCSYDTRTDRSNFVQKQKVIFDEMSLS